MADTLKIAVLDDYLEVAQGLADWDRLEAEITFFKDVIAPEDLAQRLADFDVVIAMRERSRFDAGLIEQLPNLKLLVSTGARNAAIDMQACEKAGIEVRFAAGSGLGNNGTAELAWALLMALNKGLVSEVNNLRAGLWQTQIPPVLAKKRLGIVGLGKQGQKLARYGQAFEMDVVAWSPNLTDERAAAAGVTRVSKDELFASSDFISVHLVLSETTQHVIDAQALASMKPSAYLINTSRAGLIDTVALKAALDEGRLAGAGLDVFDVEPLPVDDPWRQVPNALLTPHIGYSNTENFAAYFPNAVETIADWQASLGSVSDA